MNGKILVCDDDEGILNMIGTLLKISGYTVIKQLHSVHVMNDVKTHNPDLIILDLWMPVMNGEEVIKELKANRESSDIPILVVSASTEGKATAERMNVSDFIAKPFDARDFLSTVKKYIPAS